MDRPGFRRVPEGSGEQGKMEKTGYKIICGAPTTLAVKELMMMMYTSIAHADLVHDVTDKDRQVQNGGDHDRVFATFKSRFVTDYAINRL